MKALVVRAPMDFSIERVPVPEAPRGGFLLRVTACGLCGSDLRTLRSGHRKVTFPWTLGHEIAGVMVQAGPDYAGPWQIGDALAVGPIAYCGVCDFCRDGRYELCEDFGEIAQAWPGGLAEYIAIPEPCVTLGNILLIPNGLDPAYAAISEPVSSCVNAQEVASVGLSDTVVIFGAGPVGCIHASLARARGADRVFMIDIVRDRLELARAFGPDALVDASQTDPVARVRELTAGKGATVVITATPAPIASVQAVEMARKAGRIVVFGGLPKDNCTPGVNYNTIHYNALRVIGTTIFAPRHQRIALDLMASGRLTLEKLVHRFPLAAFERGARLALDGKLLKAVFEPHGVAEESA